MSLPALLPVQWPPADFRDHGGHLGLQQSTRYYADEGGGHEHPDHLDVMSLIIIMSGELQIIMTKRDCLNFATSINMNNISTIIIVTTISNIIISPG